VLVVPAKANAHSIGRHILVSWDGGREAARALQLALPLLAAADRVSIAVFELSSDQQTLADAIAADPRAWLARHGIQASLSVHAIEHHLRLSRKNEIGERLLAVAAESGADLLVMGAYGHSRLREAMLGGVTRTVLEEMTLPVLMAH
jgi:nucleotide-binding universal stress UspA family protein